MPRILRRQEHHHEPDGHDRPDRTADRPDRTTERARAPEAGPTEQVERRAPDTPTDLPKSSWWAVLKGTAKEFKKDELADRAAALTYYGILALFPTCWC